MWQVSMFYWNICALADKLAFLTSCLNMVRPKCWSWSLRIYLTKPQVPSWRLNRSYIYILCIFKFLWQPYVIYTDSSCESVFLCYSTEMWFKANSAERGQLAVAPSQHLFNGLEEIHSQIKQARRKKLKKNIHTHTHARQLKICSPGLSNKKDSLFIYSRIAAPHFMTTRRLSKCVWVQLHGCSLTCEAQSWKMRTIWNLLFKD